MRIIIRKVGTSIWFYCCRALRLPPDVLLGCDLCAAVSLYIFFFFQAEDGIRDLTVTGVQTCALPISRSNTSSFRSGTTDTLPPLYSYSGGLSASLVLFDGFNRFANLRASAATQDAAAAGLVSQRYQTTFATQQAFFAALADDELVRVAEAQVQRAREELQISVNKFQAGAATRSDTLTSTVDLGTARLALLQAQANLATAQATLGRQIGVDQLVRAVPDTTLPPVPATTALRAAALQTAPLGHQAQAQPQAARAPVAGA